MLKPYSTFIQQGTIYTLGMKITSAEAHQIDLLTLNTLEFPNYYILTRDMEIKGWAIGQKICKKQWVEVRFSIFNQTSLK